MAGRGVRQHPADPARPARSQRSAPHAQRVPVRRPAACAGRSPALARPARGLEPPARHRPARHLAGSLDGADRDRRTAGADRSGLGRPCLTLSAGRAAALPTGAGAAARAAADRPGADLARPLRSPRLPDHPPARPRRRALRDLARRGRAPAGMGHPGRAHHRTRLVGDLHAARARPEHHGCALAAFFGARAEGPQRHAVVVDGDPLEPALGVLQRRHRPHDRLHAHRPAPGALRPGDARGRRLSSVLGRHPPGTGQRPEGPVAAGRRRAAAGALGHVQPGAARLGRAARDPAGAGARRPGCRPAGSRVSRQRRVSRSARGGSGAR